MRRAPSIAALVVLASGAGCGGCSGEPRVVATLRWSGFRPGCLVLLATPAGAPQPQSVQVLLQDADRAGERSVAVYAPPGQGPQISLEAQALERDCDGAVVARAQDGAAVSASPVPVTLALSADDPDDDGYVSPQAALPGTDCLEGDAYVHPKLGGEDECDGIDDDCNGATDDSFNVGQLCTGDGGCTGRLVCAGPFQTRCNAYVADWYRDRDGDDAGSQLLGRFCGPDAGLAGAAGDCDDLDPYVHPGAAEVCDGKDDDCDGTADNLPAGSCSRNAVPASLNLLTVYGDSRGHAWAAGLDGGLVALGADGGTVVRSGICGTNDWRALFVDAQGRPYVGAPF
ncbi:MAG TPA: putative metal-binding motif-containing protein, partial [Myxococcales bacterium]|nr:putative metal-binding motif-containing protein [Myxococcales bacterium]